MHTNSPRTNICKARIARCYSALALPALACAYGCASTPALDERPGDNGERQKVERGPLGPRVVAAHGGGMAGLGAMTFVMRSASSGGEPALDARVRVEPSTFRFLVEGANGATLGFDGEQAWTHGDASASWVWLLFVPWTMARADTQLGDELLRPLVELELVPSTTVKVAGGRGRWDGPASFVAYLDPKIDRLVAVGFERQQSDAEAAASPSTVLVTVDSDARIGDRWLPTELSIYPWSEGFGRVGEPRATWSFSDFEFVPHAPDAFDRPVDAVLVAPGDLPR